MKQKRIYKNHCYNPNLQHNRCLVVRDSFQQYLFNNQRRIISIMKGILKMFRKKLEQLNYNNWTNLMPRMKIQFNKITTFI